ncbi:uncharacterized protein LOC143292316 [Babylonia areolata]|uniref:uncharacterized protein LOC143292316 n=1 Tax=Babylonia areolata TaxID=304850 RepID=UPI003FD50902
MTVAISVDSAWNTKCREQNFISGAKSDLPNSLQFEPSGPETSKDKGGQNEDIPEDWSHPSVFQQWLDHQPQPLVQSTSDDCLRLKGRNSQRTCFQRLQHTRQYCSARQQAEKAEGEAFSEDDGVRGGSINESVVDVFSYQQGEEAVMYCSVHKVASTFWIGLFRFLHNDTSGGGESVSSPEMLSKYRVHLTPFKQARPFALAYITHKLRPGKQQFRFMFTRNPYHRLWAVYIDKFVLPDFFFWTHHAPRIQDMVLENSDDVGKTRKPSATCFDVSFENFVEYTVQEESSSFAHSDDHMLPVSRVCNPCAFQPHFIGHLENMTEDSQAVLNRLNLSHVVHNTDFQARAMGHMRTIIDFVHDTIDHREGLRHCVSNEDLQARLLRAFILSGYLPPDVAHRRWPSVNSSPTQLFNMIRELFLDSNRREMEVEAERNTLMVNAYQSLPWELLHRVRDYYKMDFDMFGYDPEPEELFAQRAERERKAML